MYPNQLKDGDIDAFLKKNGVPGDLFADKCFKNTIHMVAHIPYDIVDDYIVYDEQNIMKWVRQTGLLRDVT